MITRINAYKEYANPTFRSSLVNPTKARCINISNLRNSYQKVSSIRNICDEIFTTLNFDKNIIEKANSVLDSVKISETSISFITDIDNIIKFSKRKNENKSFFDMEIIKDQQSQFILTTDFFGSLVNLYNAKTENIVDLENFDKKSLEEYIEMFYSTTDEPLFKLRMFIKKNATVQENGNIEKIEIKIPELVETKQFKTATQDQQLSYLEQKRDLIKKLPVTGIKHEYSYREVFRQNQKYEAVPQEEILGCSIFSKIKEIEKRSQKIKEREAIKETSAYKKAQKIKPEKTQQKEQKEEKTPALKIKKVKIKKTELKKEVTQEIKEKKAPKSIKEKTSVTKTKKTVKPTREIPADSKKVNNEKNNETIVKRRGRPRKNPVEQSENVIVTPKIIPAGKIDLNTKIKVGKIFDLYKDILNTLGLFSTYTKSFANSAYERVKVGNRQISIDNIGLNFVKRKTWNNSEAMIIADTETQKTFNILDSGEIVSPNVNIKKVIHLDKTKFLTQEEIENEKHKNILSNILDQALSKIEEYKNYLDRRGWRSVERRIAIADEGQINQKQSELLKTVEEKYNRIRTTLQRMNSGKSCCIKRDYGIVPIKSARLEFINANNDGYNLIFSKAFTKYGTLFLVVKHSGKEVLEEVFALSENGRLVKNINKNFGLNKIMNHKEKNVKFINNEQVEKENLLPRLEEILIALDKKMDDCEEYIRNYKYIKK